MSEIYRDETPHVKASVEVSGEMRAVAKARTRSPFASARLPAAPLRRLLAILAVAAALVAAGWTGCREAPSSRPARGAVAQEVRSSLAGGAASFDHSEWSRLLARGTSDGLVDYPYFRERRATLDTYLSRVAEADLPELAPAELEALLINAYNALALRTILEHPDVTSIREIDGAFDGIEHRVGGHDLTLDQIEHNILRPFFEDPRIHFAVNCASISCAPLAPPAFTGDGLDAQLERRTRTFLEDRSNVRVQEGTLLLSKYFDWYAEDFTRRGWEPRASSIPEFVAMYALPRVREFVAEHDGDPPVRYLEYDWSLNSVDAPAPPAGGEPDARARGAEEAEAEETEGEEAEEAEDGWTADLRRWVGSHGAAAPVLYGTAYAIAVVAFLPGAPLTIGAGVAFGLLWGTVLVSIASVLGATAAFLLGRHLMRDRVEGWLTSRERFAALDRAIEREGWKVVALTRLSPLFPFSLQNYAYGLTGVELGPYVLASWIAMLPGTLLYVYLGAAGVQVAEAAGGGADWGRTALQLIGLAATVAVVVLVARVARKELEKAAEDTV